MDNLSLQQSVDELQEVCNYLSREAINNLIESRLENNSKYTDIIYCPLCFGKHGNNTQCQRND